MSSPSTSDLVTPMATSSKTLTFNGREFAPRGEALPAGASGFFEADRVGIHLYKPSGHVAAFLVANPSQGFFAVTARPYEGRVRYMFACDDETESWLGVAGMQSSYEESLIREAASQVR